jgi:hypothetical protein
VREILERLKNAQIAQGREIEIYYSRGVVTRDPLNGGGQERHLVRYAGSAAALDQRWPRTTELLR